VLPTIWRRGWSNIEVFRLVYVETFDDPVSAITREKQMKKWNRDWKIRLIEEGNPDWSDLTHLLQ
jgi:putative endonuclease